MKIFNYILIKFISLNMSKGKTKLYKRFTRPLKRLGLNAYKNRRKIMLAGLALSLARDAHRASSRLSNPEFWGSSLGPSLSRDPAARRVARRANELSKKNKLTF